MAIHYKKYHALSIMKQPFDKFDKLDGPHSALDQGPQLPAPATRVLHPKPGISKSKGTD
jgi:hypothetical protein